MISVPCNLCGRDDWEIRYPATLPDANVVDVGAFRCTSPSYGRHPQIVACRHCGLVYANPQWPDADLLAAYAAVEDETYQQEREGRVLTFGKHLEAMERYTGPGDGRSLLDVGAYTGVFVEIAAAAGWDAVGIEPSDWAVAQAQQHGLNVQQGTLDAPHLAGQQFDVITMWDVIEHLADPAAEIDKVARHLPPGGWFVAHTMDVDSLTARLMGKRWPWLMDMHLYYFSQKTLAAMLRQKGFEIVWSGVQGRYLRLGYLADRLRAFNRPLGRLAEKLVADLNLRETAVPVNFGDLFTVYARKQIDT